MASPRLRRPDDDPPGAWRRNPYLLMLVLIPLSAVVMAAVMVPLSLRSFDGVVVDDYYKEGLRIDRKLARDQRAATLGLAGEAHLDAGAGAVELQLAGMPSGEWPQQLEVSLLHATRGGRDQHHDARHLGGGQYRAQLQPLAPGRWYLGVEAGEWRLRGELVAPHGTRVELR